MVGIVREMCDASFAAFLTLGRGVGRSMDGRRDAAWTAPACSWCRGDADVCQKRVLTCNSVFDLCALSMSTATPRVRAFARASRWARSAVCIVEVEQHAATRRAGRTVQKHPIASQTAACLCSTAQHRRGPIADRGLPAPQPAAKEGAALAARPSAPRLATQRGAWVSGEQAPATFRARTRPRPAKEATAETAHARRSCVHARRASQARLVCPRAT